MLRLQLTEKNLGTLRSAQERQNKMGNKRFQATGGRPEFFGEPKPFQEIVELTSSLDIIPLKSEDRSLALEELIVYANSSL